MRASRKRLVVGARDLHLMRLTFEHRTISREQVANILFSGCKRQIVERRLSKLCEHRYLQRKTIFHEGRIVSCYELTEKGISIVSGSYKYEMTNPIFKSDSLAHDICLVDIRDRLKKSAMLSEYIPENILQSCAHFSDTEEFKPFVRLNSDAALLINTPSGRYSVALEYEGSGKAIARYTQKLTDYYLSTGIAAVFYVCENDGIEKVIRQVDREVGTKLDPKIYTCLLQTLQRGGLPLTFHNRRNGKFILN
ncbi:MAG: replication-relaxation family protein [Bdellovibrionales bacterium]|nr:replication-relaxation family protein [Bdellovibrionales bacterium]